MKTRECLFKMAALVLFSTGLTMGYGQHEFVRLQDVAPTIIVELRYAGTDNFMGQKVYSESSKGGFVLKEVAACLKQVQDELAQRGLGLKIWDALRTFEAQEAFWKMCPDERYVSNPKKGGRHTRGTTVDVTLIRLADGQELEMPTPFDDFSEKAHSDYDDISAQARENRQLLHDIMEKHGFSGLKTEWWHFDLKNWQDFEPFMGRFEDLTENKN